MGDKDLFLADTDAIWWVKLSDIRNSLTILMNIEQNIVDVEIGF